MIALRDGYFRDAVLSFAASYERFLQCYIEVVISHRLSDCGQQINWEPPDHVIEEITATWKLVKIQSERQLGMYLSLYLVENGCTPPILNNKLPGFRNNVAHQGYMPSIDEAIWFCQGVIDIVQTIINNIRTKYHSAFRGIRILHQKRVNGLPREEGAFNQSVSLPMIFNLNRPIEDSPMRLGDELRRRKDSRSFIYNGV